MTCISHAEPVEEVPHTLSLHLSDSEKDLLHLLLQQPHGQQGEAGSVDSLPQLQKDSVNPVLRQLMVSMSKSFLQISLSVLASKFSSYPA